jgi:hypothetical protein
MRDAKPRSFPANRKNPLACLRVADEHGRRYSLAQNPIAGLKAPDKARRVLRSLPAHQKATVEGLEVSGTKR